MLNKFGGKSMKKKGSATALQNKKEKRFPPVLSMLVKIVVLCMYVSPRVIVSLV